MLFLLEHTGNNRRLYRCSSFGYVIDMMIKHIGSPYFKPYEKNTAGCIQQTIEFCITRSDELLSRYYQGIIDAATNEEISI